MLVHFISTCTWGQRLGLAVCNNVTSQGPWGQMLGLVYNNVTAQGPCHRSHCRCSVGRDGSLYKAPAPPHQGRASGLCRTKQSPLLHVHVIHTVM